jgi:hypothetical protein
VALAAVVWLLTALSALAWSGAGVPRDPGYSRQAGRRCDQRQQLGHGLRLPVRGAPHAISVFQSALTLAPRSASGQRPLIDAFGWRTMFVVFTAFW